MILRKLFLFSILICFAYSNEAIQFTQDEKNYLKEKKEITFCFSPKGLPLSGYKEGQNIGIFPEVISLVGKKIPIPFRYVPVKTWKECLDLSLRKKVDIATMIITSPNGHTHLIPSHKLLDGFIAIATKINEPFSHDLHSLDTQKVAFIKGHVNIQKFVKGKFPNLNVVLVDTIEEGLKQVAEGKVYGYVDETYSLAYNILHLYNNELKVMNKVNSTPLSASLGIHKDQIELLNIINKAIDSIDEKELREIIHSWISVRIESVFDYKFLIQIVTGLLLILLAGLYIIRTKQIKQQNIYLVERLKLAFDGSRDGLWDWNLITNTVYFSPRWKEMLGYKEDELENNFDTWRSRVHPDDLERALKHINLCINDKEEVFENKHRLQHKDGHWVWIYDRGKVQHDKDGKAIRMIGTHTDLTTEINLSNELRELNETLENRVKKQVEKLDRQHVYMVKQSRLADMGEMLSSIAHQWRQPLNRINSNIVGLRSALRRDPINLEMVASQTEMMEENTQYMSETIEDFSNFFNPKKKETEFIIEDIINKALNFLIQRIRNVEVIIETKKEIKLFSFEKEFLQVLLIILNNAIDNFESNFIKHPKIDITIYEKDDRVYLTICDNGKGIDNDKIDRIFDPYYTTKFSHEGTGIGLYMAKMIIENSMHGKLQAKNKNSGACFEIKIPLGKINV